MDRTSGRCIPPSLADHQPLQSEYATGLPLSISIHAPGDHDVGPRSIRGAIMGDGTDPKHCVANTGSGRRSPRLSSRTSRLQGEEVAEPGRHRRADRPGVRAHHGRRPGHDLRGRYQRPRQRWESDRHGGEPARRRMGVVEMRIGLAIGRGGGPLPFIERPFRMRMGGHVGIQSQPRQGSRFWVELPKPSRS